MIQKPPINKAIKTGVNFQVYPADSIEPVNANPIQVPNGLEMTTIANQNDFELNGKYASTNRGP